MTRIAVRAGDVVVGDILVADTKQHGWIQDRITSVVRHGRVTFALQCGLSVGPIPATEYVSVIRKANR